MVNKNKTIKKTRKTSSRKNKKKAKIYIPTNKIIILCSIVVIFCSALLFVNTFCDIESYNVTEPNKISKEDNKSKSDRKELESKNKIENEKVVTKKNSETSTNKINDSIKKESKEIKKDVSDSVLGSVDDKVAFVPPPKNPAPIPVVKTDIPTIPFAENNARVVIILDDGGQNLEHLKKFINLPFPLTIAVLPKLQHSKEAATLIRANGKELMLHQPMQAINLNVSPGPGAITPEMTLIEVENQLRNNISEIGPIKGVNNHEGSLICEDEIKIGLIMKILDSMGLYFVDSRTTSQTRVPQAAMGLGLSYYERNIFLDNEKTRKNIISEFMKGLSIANKNGVVIMIGHVWSSEVLANVFADLYPILIEKGYRFTTVSESGALITP